MYARLGALALLLQAAGVGAAEWTQFSNTQGNFRIEFPAAPQESVQNIETQTSRIPYTTFSAEVSDGNVAYGLVYHDYPPGSLPADPEVVLDACRDGPKNDLPGAVVSETHMTYRGHPAREFSILSDVQGRKLFCHMRVFLIGSRLYQLQIVRVGETPVDVADAVRFFASFEPLSP
jgi:hypothetical protein